ncbi:tRNA 5-methylaminomethyl-2-thiouridine biosynthesis bifunctional protein MnmC [mine drainage metagenome]|uniref:tRNA 5-methylaminomethyl-2-thiouridine biosynthesis bifunctional protein MnmC n=1 Tax=mine drainage metagenome TaxID=410659 RepID=A0A1J5SV49_9ZZZZ
MQTPITSNSIEWRDGQPYASAFQDVYFSTDNGLEETKFVFLTQNDLAIRFKNLKNANFTIAETGFGTGLNFLSAWQLWSEHAPSDSCLHFISVEKYPLTVDDISLAQAYWPTLADYSQQLLTQYRQLTPGIHQLSFANGKVTLNLLIGDVSEMLPQIETPVEAWFLDGFSPAKNPDMWSASLFQNMARLSHSLTTFATFTSAGDVRRGLQAVGFQVKKLAGFGKKREMLRGHFIGNVS